MRNGNGDDRRTSGGTRTERETDRPISARRMLARPLVEDGYGASALGGMRSTASTLAVLH